MRSLAEKGTLARAVLRASACPGRKPRWNRLSGGGWRGPRRGAHCAVGGGPGCARGGAGAGGCRPRCEVGRRGGARGVSVLPGSGRPLSVRPVMGQSGRGTASPRAPGPQRPSPTFFPCRITPRDRSRGDPGSRIPREARKPSPAVLRSAPAPRGASAPAPVLSMAIEVATETASRSPEQQETHHGDHRHLDGSNYRIWGDVLTD